MGLLDMMGIGPNVTPDQRMMRGGVLTAIGQGLSQMDAGQPIDMQPAFDALNQRMEGMKMRKALDNPDLLAGFTPQQRQLISILPPEVATQIIAQNAFAPPPDPVNLQTFTGPDGVVYSFNPQTGERAPLTGAKQPDPGYRMLTPEEATASGLDPNKDYQVNQQDGRISEIGGGGVSVNIPDGNSGAFGKKADELAAARLSGYIDEGAAATRMMGDLKAVAAIGTQIETGKLAEAKAALGPYAQALGVDINGLGEAQAYQAIIDRLAPQMRPTGAGSSSDTDVRMFLNSLPGLGNTPDGNLIIQQTFDALNKHKMAAAEIASQAMSNQITWQEADKKIRALGDPYEAFNEYRKKTGAMGGSGAGSYTPKGVVRYDAEGNRIP